MPWRGTGLAALFLTTLLATAAVTGHPELDVQRYSLNLTLAPENRSVSGRATIHVEAKGLSTLELELGQGLNVTSLVLNQVERSYTRKGRLIEVPLREPLDGEAEVQVSYSGRLLEGAGARRWSYMDDESAYATYESSWYPRVPGERARAEISIKAPQSWVVVSNGERMGSTWEVKTPETGYSFAAGRYSLARSYAAHTPVTCYLRSPDPGCPARLSRMLEFYSTTLTSFPYPKLDLVEVSRAMSGGHGDSSLILMSPEMLRSDEREEYLAHEVAHNWFGGLVAPEDTKWLAEGLASYAAILYLENQSTVLARNSLSAMREEYLETWRRGEDKAILAQSTEYDEVFHATVYSKGALILHMLRFMMGDEGFYNALRSYLARHAWGSASVGDFRRAAEEASGLELQRFFTFWLNSTGLPDLAVQWVRVEREGERYSVTARIVQVGDVISMPVEVTARGGDEEVDRKVWIRSREQEVRLSLGSEPTVFEIDREGWLLERSRENNRYIIRYPPNLEGVKLLLSTLSARLRALFNLKP